LSQFRFTKAKVEVFIYGLSFVRNSSRAAPRKLIIETWLMHDSRAPISSGRTLCLSRCELLKFTKDSFKFQLREWRIK